MNDDSEETHASNQAVSDCVFRSRHARWPEDGAREYDILAIDRDGQGEAHVIEIKRTAQHAFAHVPTLLDPAVKAPFCWAAYLRGTEDAETSIALVSKQPLYAKTSPGRVGVVQFFTMAGSDIGTNIIVKADRFPGGFYDLSRAFSASHAADQQY